MARAEANNIRSRIHQQIIDSILADWPEAKTHGFFRALRDLPDAEYVPTMLRDDKDWYSFVRFVPDVWLINPEDRHVVAFEAVHAHDVSARKFAKLCDLSWALDEDYYRLILVRCDRFSRRAYDVQAASFWAMMEDIEAGRQDTGWYVDDWPKYDVEYCQELSDAAA